LSRYMGNTRGVSPAGDVVPFVVSPCRSPHAGGWPSREGRPRLSRQGGDSRTVRSPSEGVWAATETRHNQVWVGDITYLRLAEGWRYLTIVLDHHARRVIAWTLSRRRTARETCAVLHAALQRRRPPRGLIFHSDRGTEYMARPSVPSRRVAAWRRARACAGRVTMRAQNHSFTHSRQS